MGAAAADDEEAEEPEEDEELHTSAAKDMLSKVSLRDYVKCDPVYLGYSLCTTLTTSPVTACLFPRIT